MKRRQLIAGGVGLAAALAGIGTALWRNRADTAADDFWTLRLPRPGGGELAFAELRGRPLLLNFWATWCAPCVSEMPLLDRFASAQRPRGWQVVGVAIDEESAVRDFIAQRRIAFPIGLGGAAGLEWSRALGNVSGGLPYSVVFGASGLAVARKAGVVDEQILKSWVDTHG